MRLARAKSAVRSPPTSRAQPEKGKFKNLDGEGVAYSEPYFYVVGSHGCARHEKKANLSSLILARVHVDSEGKMVGDGSTSVETTYRLNDIFRNNPNTCP